MTGKSTYRERKNKGLCVICERPLDNQGARCSACTAKEIISRRKQRQQLAEAGLCTQCGKQKPIEGIRTCEACKAKRAKAPSVVNRFAYDIRKHYNISDIDYYNMLKWQGGVCKICGKQDTDRRLGVDHDHDTGQVRALLCKNCNLILGVIENSGVPLHAYYDYLIKHKSMPGLYEQTLAHNYAERRKQAGTPIRINDDDE